MSNNNQTTTQTTCPYCGVGCGVLVNEQQDGTITVEGDPTHPANFGHLCSKGASLAETIDLDGRILYPELHQQTIDWDTALTTAAQKIQSSINKYGSDSVAFYVSGQLLTEDYYIANKLIKGFIGTANIDTNSRLCMASAVAAYKRAFGTDTVPCDYTDLEACDLIVLVGSNLAWCHPVIYQRIVKYKKQNNNLRVVVIDPMRTASCDVADLHLPIKPGTDVMLFNGLLNYLHDQKNIDWDYLKSHVSGYTETLDTVKQTAHSIASVAEFCDVSESSLNEFFSCFAKTTKTVTLFSQGVNQSSAGTDKGNAIINCHLATGRIGKSGMGPFSITGQPNAMGGREVGGLANQLAAHLEITDPNHRQLVKAFWQSPTIAEKPGLKAVDLFNAVYDGQIKVIWIMATNPVVSMPNADLIAKALSRCEFVIVSDCMRHTDTTQYADLLLPALGWAEKDGTVTNSERRISRQRAFLKAPGDAKSDWWIIQQVAQRMGFDEAFDYSGVDEIFSEHAELSDYKNSNGTVRDFNISGLAKLNTEEYDQLEPQQWPMTNGTVQRLFSDGIFFTKNKKANMIATEPRLPEYSISPEYPVVLNTGRVRDHWHTLTRTGKSSRLSAHISEPYCAVHPHDAAKYQLEEDTLVKITSEWGSCIARCRVSREMREGNIFVPMHWNGQFAAHARVDSVVNPATDPISGQPECKHTPVRLSPVKISWEGFLISRSPVKFNTDYWVKSKGTQHTRYEIAGAEPHDWPSWAKYLLCSPFPNAEYIEYQDPAIGRYRAACVQNGRLQSCLFIAPTHNQLPDKSWLESLFEENTLDKIERACLLAGQPSEGNMNCGPTVCSCFSVGRNTILNAIVEHNLMNAEEIGEKLQAGTNCGSCIPELKTLISNTQKQA